MRGSLLVFIIFLWKQDQVRSIRLLDLRVPGYAAAGGEAILGCQYDMEGDTLYSLRWYKDYQEFYRYTPTNDYPVALFFAPGVKVNRSRSSSDLVTLVNLERESEGMYRCEVTGEAPLFTVVTDEKHMNIHVLPQRGPQVTGLHHAYKIGDRVAANCTTGASKPGAQIKWLINGKSVRKEHLRGPWYRVAEPPDTTETVMQLSFKVMPVHFKRGIIEVKCQASIAPLYQQEVLYRVTEMPDLPSLSEEDVQTTTYQYHSQYEYSKEDEYFRRNALYEIRQRLYRRLNASKPLDIETARMPVEKEQDKIEIAITTPSTFSSNDQDSSILPPNSGTLLQRSTLLILLTFLNHLWHMYLLSCFVEIYVQ